MRLLRNVIRDAVSLALPQGNGHVTGKSLLEVMLNDGYCVLAMSRVRQSARRWRIPFVNRTLRLVQMAVYGIEIAKDVELGEGVNFMHTLGTVIGGNTKIGARTIFLGSITVGNLNNRGYPVIGEDVIVGAGARILGPIVIGSGALIGANAVVVTDVPAGATAIGVPASIKTKSNNAEPRRGDVAAS